MRFSVVINTYNRSQSLRKTLLSLRHQTYSDFEVIVVNGPSTDDTDSVLAEFDGSIRAYRCAKARLSVSRNIGLAEASGDVVAFIDDDAIPTPHWMEELAAAHREPGVGAVGGLVYDQTGVRLQYRFAACYRDGRPDYQVTPPLDQYLRPFADPVAYLQGTNMSYSRDVLREFGGFDENILHYFDDVDTCLHVIDKGYKLKALDGAAVQHKFLASHIRNHDRIVLDPFNRLSDRIYFAFRHGRATRTVRQIVDCILAEADHLRKEADRFVASGAMSAAQQEVHHRRLDEALEIGLNKGLTVARAGRDIPPARSPVFLPFPTLRPAGARLKLCFLSTAYPSSAAADAAARRTHELAAGFGGVGHEVHVVARSPDIYRLDFEDNVWVHRIPEPERYLPELDGVAARESAFNAAAAYHEVCKIHADRPVDLVAAPFRPDAALVCGLDERFPTAAPDERAGQQSADYGNPRALLGEFERCYRSAIADHKKLPGRNPTGPIPLAAVGEKLAASFVSAGLSSGVATKAVSRLLDPRHHPVDLACQFGKFWHAQPAQFIAESFSFLFSRPARPYEITGWIGEVRRGLQRIDLIRLFIESEEGRNAYPAECIRSVADAFGPGPFGREIPDAVVPVAAPSPKTLRHRLSGLGFVGKVLKYCRRALYMPWNFDKFYHEFENGAHIIQETAARQAATEQLITNEILPALQTLATVQEQLRGLVRASETAVSLGHERIQSALDVQTTRIGDAIGMVVAEMTLPDLDDDIPQPRHVETLRRAG